MQGVVFTLFSDCVIENFGMEVWDELLEKVSPESEGVYTSGDTYEDSELFAYVGELSNKTGVAATDLVRTFGEYMFSHLLSHMPQAVKPGMSLKDFLLTVDQVIHKEVKRLHPNSYLPEIDYENSSDEQLIMIYRSKRKLCHLAEGLIFGAAKHFKTEVSIEHPLCMHRDDDHCRLEISFQS
jgi:predicted hydrocarbon binding protein